MMMMMMTDDLIVRRPSFKEIIGLRDDACF